MNFDKLLEYQEVDIQLRRVLDVIERSEDYKRMEHTKKEFALAKKSVEESEAQATSLVEFYSNAQKYYDDTLIRIKELETAVESGADEDEEVLQKLLKLRGRLTDMETKLSELKNRAETVIKTYMEANERGRKLREVHAKAKERQDELVKSKQDTINELKGKLSDIEPKIDKEFLAKYKSLTAEMKYPAFVEAYADGGTYSCKGCGLALSQKNTSNLNDDGYCTCETCRRIIYKKQ